MTSNLKLAIEQADAIRKLVGDGDPELLHDMLEGETDVFELVDWLIGKIADEEEIQAAIQARVAALSIRATACEGRIERLRSGLLACMNACGEKSMRRPEATVSVS